MNRRTLTLLPAAAALVAYLRGSIPSEPRVCSCCGRIATRLAPAQCAQIANGQKVTCRRGRCGGRLTRVGEEMEAADVADAVDETRDRLAKHLRYCLAKPDDACLQCAAARLVESFPDNALAPVARPVLDDLLATVERAATELDGVIAYLSDHDDPMRAALNSLAVTTDSGALTAILADAACTPGHLAEADENLVDATARLNRIAAVHRQLVAELSSPGKWLGRPLRARMVRLLATAWHGRPPDDPREPLTPDPA